MQHRKTTALMLCALFTALISVTAFIRIPAPLVPITLQSGMVLLAGLLLGPKYGSLSVLLYVLLGLVGIPVFALGGGLAYIFQPTFGYLLGFIAGAYLTGVLAWRTCGIGRNISVKRLYIAVFSGLMVIYMIGTLYCYMISVFVLGTALAFWPLILSCILFPLPGDLLLCILAVSLGKQILPFTARYVI